ncbi:hypothetical protein EQ875_01616 [Photobacterium damselae subsp. damselae]|uniref:hypothetical protein n=1 Tax=Photobacterium damselae TaxID=38293 RepID=UPI00109B97EE|nr:hypothetical protein [Photobacterium damselae]TGZ35335.1 hypothetical protein EQ875_01616 [Photobacterium damselae subsp. damselae]
MDIDNTLSHETNNRIFGNKAYQKSKINLQGGKLKRILSKKSELKCRIKCETSSKQKKTLQYQLSLVNEKIRRLTSTPVVTEHAILRYLERVKGISVSDIEQEILNNDAIKLIEEYGIGSAKIPHSNGCRLIVEDKTVITIEV